MDNSKSLEGGYNVYCTTNVHTNDGTTKTTTAVDAAMTLSPTMFTTPDLHVVVFTNTGLVTATDRPTTVMRVRREEVKVVIRQDTTQTTITTTTVDID